MNISDEVTSRDLLDICGSTTNPVPCKSRPKAKYLDGSSLQVITYGYFAPPIIFITLITNFFVCLVLMKKKMRNPTSILLVALAISDSLTGLLPLPLFIYFYTMGNYKHYMPFVPYGVCSAYVAFKEILPTMSHTCSIWLTVTLALQRYLFVCYPVRAKTLGTIPKTVKMIVFVLIISVATHVCRFTEYSYVPVSYRQARIWSRPEPPSLKVTPPNQRDMSSRTHSSEDDSLNFYGRLLSKSLNVSQDSPAVESSLGVAADEDGDGKFACYREPWRFYERHISLYNFIYYFLIRTVLIYLLPCVLLVVVNYVLIREMRIARDRRLKLLKAKVHGRSAGSSCEGQASTLMLVVVVCCFLLVELPLAVLFILITIRGLFKVQLEKILSLEVQVHASILLNAFIMFSYPINFFIYCIMSRSFRQSFFGLFRMRHPQQLETDRVRRDGKNLKKNGRLQEGTRSQSDLKIFGENTAGSCPPGHVGSHETTIHP